MHREFHPNRCQYHNARYDNAPKYHNTQHAFDSNRKPNNPNDSNDSNGKSDDPNNPNNSDQPNGYDRKYKHFSNSAPRWHKQFWQG